MSLYSVCGSDMDWDAYYDYLSSNPCAICCCEDVCMHEESLKADAEARLDAESAAVMCYHCERYHRPIEAWELCQECSMCPECCGCALSV